MKEYREEVGLTQVQVADSLQITREYVSLIEREQRTPGFKLAQKISKLFGKSIEEVFPSE
ncbi:helix-turn-helix transcriptional regulator [Fusibacter sp. JL216-2]|uniref:helix-turn-helix transcriptional regulator n=1 Tax=Fusibacter sp. JL216-2 TaxID=3071453 RepID=UPI003D3478DB